MRVPFWRTAARSVRKKSPAKTAAQRANANNASIARTGLPRISPAQRRRINSMNKNRKKSDFNIFERAKEKARQKTPTFKSSRPNNAKGVTQGGIPQASPKLNSPTQASVAQQAKQVKRKMYSGGGSVTRTGHTDYRKKGMFK